MLAVVVGLGSVTLYIAAFFFPEVHRRHDFFWSGVGLFYALVLWVCAVQVTPTLWLGHLASVSLLGWLGWQTLSLRRRRTPLAFQTPFTEDSWSNFRRELVALAQGFLRQTPLGRWFPALTSQPDSNREVDQNLGWRASSLKDVGYEFLDNLESEEGAAVSATMGRRLSDSPAQGAPVVERSRLPQASSSVSHLTAGRRTKVGTSPPQPGPWWQKGQVIVTWTQELIGSMTTPKPKKPVIEIPPRSPSIPPKSANPGSQRTGAEPNGSAPATPTTAQNSPGLAVTIVDAEVTTPLDPVNPPASSLDSEVQDRPPQPSPSDRSQDDSEAEASESEAWDG
jgi:hypothetical protein